LRLASLVPQAFTVDHFGTRVSRTPAASNRYCVRRRSCVTRWASPGSAKSWNLLYNVVARSRTWWSSSPTAEAEQRVDVTHSVSRADGAGKDWWSRDRGKLCPAGTSCDDLEPQRRAAGRSGGRSGRQPI